MRPDPRILLEDVHQAARDIVRITGVMDLSSYLDDDRTQAAVKRKFEIIGEALNRLHQTSSQLSERTPQMR